MFSEDIQGLEFSFNFADEVPQEVRVGIESAGEAWSKFISDDVNLEINVGFELLADPNDPNEGANAVSNFVEVAYSDYRQALVDNATSEDDAIAIANLPDGDSIDLLINNTQENQGSDAAYLDDNGSENNSTIELTTANAKALGLDVEDSIDATITVNNDVNWDFDRSDGIAEDAIDFKSVAIHEIGHTLGFNSGIEDLDTTASENLRELITSEEINFEDVIEVLGLEDLVTEFGLEDAIEGVDLGEIIAGSPIEPLLESIDVDLFVSEDEYTPNSMDLFRYSESSSDLGIIDLTTGEAEKYFSLDRGLTEIAQFTTGALGDGGEISHWQSGQGIGIMQAGIGPGAIVNISDTDLQLLDVIGWEIA